LLREDDAVMEDSSQSGVRGSVIWFVRVICL
jgi:hypothetical protein